MDYSFNGRLNIDSWLFGLRVTRLSTRFAVHNPVYLGGIGIPAVYESSNRGAVTPQFANAQSI